MGLTCSVSVGDLGLPTETPMLGIPIDYSDGFAVFSEVFISTAQSLCPVRTGFLQSSISCEATADGAVCSVGAGYAQYVEFGTWKMPARPFIQPALEAAMSAALASFEQAYEEAMLEEQEILQEIEDEISEMMAEDGMAEGLAGEGGLGGAILNIFAAIIIGIIMEFLKDIFSYEQGEKAFNSLKSSGFSPTINIF